MARYTRKRYYVANVLTAVECRGLGGARLLPRVTPVPLCSASAARSVSSVPVRVSRFAARARAV